MPRLTIIIPCLGIDATFDDTLATVLQHRPDDVEILVVHRDAYSDPYELSDEVTFVHVAHASSLSELANFGVDHARSAIVHVLRCGARVQDEHWCEAPLLAFQDSRVAAVSPLLLNKDGASVAASGVRYLAGGGRRLCDRGKLASKPFRLGRSISGPTNMAGFYRRETWRRLGGLSVTVGDDLADADLAASWRAAGCQTQCARESRVYLADSMSEPARLTFQAGRAWQRLHQRHAKSLGWSAVLWHPWQVLWNLHPASQESWLGLPAHFIGRLAGRFSRGKEPNRADADQSTPLLGASANRRAA